MGTTLTLAGALLIALPFAPRYGIVAERALPESLQIPVEGVYAGELKDTFNDDRAGKRPHEAIDIMAPRGTPVIAAEDGKVAKLFQSKPGGLTIYQFDETGQVAFYYAHLDRYAKGLVEGAPIKRGDVIGYVGSTGNASPTAPHLHFAMFVLGPAKRWWQGTAVNPYPYLTGQLEEWRPRRLR